MADMTLDEALAAATEDVADDTLVIDNDLRTITIPDSVKLIGVESDEDINILYFKMPKAYREFDLSEFNVRINYMNRKKVNGAYVADTYIADMYAVDDAVVDGDHIRFSWLVGRNAAKYMGDTKFIVCLKKTDAAGNVIKEFNTTLAVLPVLEGLETTEQIVQENPDIIEQMLKKIEGLTEIGPEDIAQAVADYMTANPVNIPEKLPNPQKLIFTGAVTAEYDGSGAVTVTIPDGTIERVEKSATDTDAELQPGKLYVFPEMASLTLTLAAPADTTIVNEYHCIFASGETATALTIPDTIKIPDGFTVEANKIYELSVLEDCLSYMSWDYTAEVTA